MSESWPVQVRVAVRERDCGADGVIDESVLLILFREARRAYFGVLHAAPGPVRHQVWDLRLQIHRTVTQDDELAVRVRCDALGYTTLRFQYMLRDRSDDEVVAEGTSIQALVDAHGRPMPVPHELRLRLEAIEARSLEDLEGDPYDPPTLDVPSPHGRTW